jgi:replicative DNA helicase
MISKIKNENKELAVLANIYLVDNSSIFRLLELGLEPKHFYSLEFAKLYQKAIDTVLDGGKVVMQDISDAIIENYEIIDIDCSNYYQDAQDIIELSDKRVLAGKLIQGIQMIEQDKSKEEIVNVIEGSLQFSDKKVETLQDIQFESYYNNKQGEKGIMTGFPSFDYSGVKFLNGQLIAVGADTGVGKTTFLVHIMAQQIKLGNKVLLFSLEEPARKIMMRFLKVLSGYHISQIISGEAPEEQIRHWDKIIKENVQTVYKAGLTIAELKSRAKMLHARYNFSVIGVDYWQLLNGVGVNKLEQLVNVADNLLSIAISMDLPVITLGQVDKASSRLQKLDRNSFSGSKQLSNNSAYIIMLQKEKEEDGDIIIEIVKSRESHNYGRTVRTEINPFTDKLTEKQV